MQNVSFKIPAGQSLALVGPSGGGKTTLCSLIPRFYDPDQGKILIDGKNVKDLTLRSLRKNVGIVQQDVYLFDGTIADNIRYGRPEATEEEILEACRKANLLEFIESLPDGIYTEIGERGARLSGGQKQRISIARIFLKDPRILILDEATSALDNESERIVQESLDELSKGRTCISIAHRLSTIKNADEIAVVSENGIQERGTHEELMKNNGLYANYYRLQFRTDSNDEF
ncbi:ABC transporter ATP-binding protein [Ileibacterium valens]|uniref:ABC transporter ATP-binding protein n=1 Tax=Ileibacterium valens TaxID=1862668 RepID=UPI0023547461|nr:ATP-binding cassette domain-containing protein [Ileibacterium valens]